ncbi:MAG: polyketide synthase, partial [Rhodospirillaceae bacterium]
DELAAVFCASHRERLEMLTGWSPQAAKPAAMPAPPPQTPPQSLHDRPEIGPAQAPDPVASSTLDSWAQDSGSQDIAIIGLSVRFPGAEDLEAFWSLLSEGRSGITEVPAERWDWRDATAGWNDPSDPASVGAKGLGSGRWGGFLADVDAFDALFFSISPREAARIAPETRLFLQTAWNAIEQAGYTPKGLKQPAKGLAGDVGVFAGCMYQHYPMQSPDPMDRGALAGTSYWSIANRVSHFLDFQGPSLAIDTACSSSLTAIHMACDSLRRGECATALAGGVNLTLDAGKYLNLRQAGMLASTPESRALGDGDGLIPAEGVGVVVLKPLAQAKADGDRILGVIKASVVNNGGRTAGFTVPNPKAQADLVGAALDRAGI